MPGVQHGQPVSGEAVYGEDIVPDELHRLGDCVVITSQTPWALHADRFPRKPLAVVMPGTLERSELDEMSNDVPRGARIVGLGGGSVIDAAKYFALLQGEIPVLIPSVASSNGPFSDWISVRQDGRPAGFREPGLPKRVIVDYALIQTAHVRANRAGYGDLLPLQTTLNDWRISATASRADPPDPEIEASAMALMRQAMASAREIGSLSRRGIEMLMRLTEASTVLMTTHSSHPLNAGSEHLFAWTLESITRRHFLHGEIVALGIVISSYVQGRDHEPLTRALNEARVTYQPDRLGLEWSEIERTLLGIAQYNREVRHYRTVYDEIEWTPSLLRKVREVVDRARGSLCL